MLKLLLSLLHRSDIEMMVDICFEYLLQQLPLQDIKCFSVLGNVDHYYHFFYNCLVPVIIFHERNSGKRLRLCASHIGDMVSIFKEVLPHMQYNRECGKDAVYLKGFDDDLGKGVKRITSSSRHLFNHHISEIEDAFTSEDVDILLIGRGRPPTEIGHSLSVDPSGTSGSQRRAIKNFGELEGALRNGFKSVASVFMEGMSVRKQFRLFRSAKVIIAQHGAALSNIFFVNNMTRGIVEISPYTMENRIGKFTHSFPDCFRYVCESIGLQYVRIRQSGEFAEVDIEAVLSAASNLLGSTKK